MKNSKKIQVVSGKGKNIKISDVQEHLEIEKPQEETRKQKIIIPTNKK